MKIEIPREFINKLVAEKLEEVAAELRGPKKTRRWRKRSPNGTRRGRPKGTKNKKTATS